MNKSDLLPKFLNTDPCGEDLLPSKSQQSISDTIVNFIETDKSDKKLIGLSGTWGSGKSNVIMQIQNRLKKTHHLFIYDAWSHQEDLQRRAFLESFTEDIEGCVKNHEIWKQKLKELLAKRKETIQQTIPKLSYPIIVAIITTMLLPITVFLAKDIIGFWYKLVVATAPIIIALVVWVISGLCNRKNWKLMALFYIYKEKQLSKVTNEVLSEKEPSIISFKKWMKDLSDVLNKDVIVVFDNMDRLPADKVRVLWSLIHSFFTGESFQKIWIIIPFDLDQLKKTFSNDTGDNDQLTRQYIEKVFPIVFHVSPIVLTEWSSFFQLKFNEAFGDIEPKELKIIKNLFDRYHDNITPRKIIVFINNLVSTKLLWQNKIPLRFQALYILNKEDISQKTIEKLLDENFMKKFRFLFEDDPEESIINNLAAIEYNVEPNLAKQVILYREIEIAIRNKDDKKLELLQKYPGFYEVLEKIFPDTEFDVESATYSINKLSEFSDNSDTQVKLEDIWNAIINKQLQTPIEDLKFNDILKMQLYHASLNKLKVLIGNIINAFHNSKKFSGETYFEALDDVKSFIEEKRHSTIDILPMIQSKEVKPEQFTSYVTIAKDRYREFKVTCNNDVLDKFLVENSANGWTGFNILQYINEEYQFPHLIDKIENTITSNAVNNDNLLIVFNTYKEITKKRPLPKKLNDPTINSLLSNISENTDPYYELVAMRLSRADGFQNFGGKSESVLLIEDESLVVKVSDKIEAYINYGDLLLKVVQWQKPLLIAVARFLTLNPGHLSKVKIKNVLSEFDKIYSILKIESIELFKRLNEWVGDLNTDNQSFNFSDIFKGKEIFELATKENNELASFIKENAILYINGLDKETWKNSLVQNNEYTTDVLNFVLKTNNDYRINENIIDGFDLAINEFIKKDISQINIPTLRTISSTIGTARIKGKVRNLRNYFFSNSYELTPRQILFFEPLLREFGDLNERPKDTVQKILTPIIKSKDDACMQLILENETLYLEIIAKAKDVDYELVKELRDMIEGCEGMAKQEKLINYERAISAMIFSSLEILEAEYWSENQRVDVIKNVQLLIDKSILHFKVTNEILNLPDPDVGVPKQLRVHYSFDSKEYTETIEEFKWIRLPQW